MMQEAKTHGMPLTNLTVSVKLLYWKLLNKASSSNHLHTAPRYLRRNLRNIRQDVMTTYNTFDHLCNTFTMVL